MTRQLLLAASLLALAGCAAQSANQHYSVVPQTRVIERSVKKPVSVVPTVVSGSAGESQ
jgi:uncharacterized lipoprotein YajG